MPKLPGRDLGVSGTAWDRLSMAGAVVGSALAWLLVLGGLISTFSALPKIGWPRGLWVVALCAALPAALLMTQRTAKVRRFRAEVPDPVLQRRRHGRLEAITDSEQRSLRPIAATAYEVAARTDELLTDLTAIPSVRIFRGVRPGGDLPLISHAISAGRHLVLVESVAWPPGHYETKADGRVHCDGTYIGQSARPLLDAVQHWRAALPKRHRVSAMVVVHADEKTDIGLPRRSPDGLMWVHACDAAQAIRQHLLPSSRTLSRSLVAALIRATADHA